MHAYARAPGKNRHMWGVRSRYGSVAGAKKINCLTIPMVLPISRPDVSLEKWPDELCSGYFFCHKIFRG